MNDDTYNEYPQNLREGRVSREINELEEGVPQLILDSKLPIEQLRHTLEGKRLDEKGKLIEVPGARFMDQAGVETMVSMFTPILAIYAAVTEFKEEYVGELKHSIMIEITDWLATESEKHGLAPEKRGIVWTMVQLTLSNLHRGINKIMMHFLGKTVQTHETQVLDKKRKMPLPGYLGG